MSKASEIISDSCCGQCLPIDCSKFKLAAMVEKLERDNELYKHALKTIQHLPSVREDESSGIAFKVLKVCK